VVETPAAVATENQAAVVAEAARGDRDRRIAKSLLFY
jgi:hypothetical protein